MQPRKAYTLPPDGFLDCRLATLGLDLGTIDAATLKTITRGCTTCGAREACELDLKRGVGVVLPQYRRPARARQGLSADGSA